VEKIPNEKGKKRGGGCTGGKVIVRGERGGITGGIKNKALK